MEEQFQYLVELLLKNSIPKFVFTGEVKELDEEKGTAVITREGEADLTDVRLNAIIDNIESRLIAYPVIGSKVLCTLIDNDPQEAFILSLSEVQKIKLNIKDQELEITESGFVFNKGELGGLIKIQELTKNLEKLTKRVDMIIQILNAAAPGPAPDAGAALIGTIKTGLATIVDKEMWNNLEDKKIQH